MRVDVAILPRDADPEALKARAVIVFDVLRATTSMTVALANGVEEIMVFPSVEAARKDAGEIGLYPKPLLCGEEKCFKPPGFDLGNSPCDFDSLVKGRRLYMCTTNGTRAILAAREAKLLLVGALVNASAVAIVARESGLDVTLMCAGTDGRLAIEDLIGAGAVIDVIARAGALELESDAARMTHWMFERSKNDLKAALSAGAGGKNVINAGLEKDIEFAASLDRFADVVGKVDGRIVRKLPSLSFS